jgi:hypothetical protein
MGERFLVLKQDFTTKEMRSGEPALRAHASAVLWPGFLAPIPPQKVKESNRDGAADL